MRCRRTSFLVVLAIGCTLTVGGCTSTADLYPKARCSDEVLADTKHDAPKIMELGPEDPSDVDGRIWRRSSIEYVLECFISEGKGVQAFLTGKAAFHGGMEYSPGRSAERFFTDQNFEGASREIKSDIEAVGGISGRGSAGVWAPCSMRHAVGEKTGAMVATIEAPTAPNGDSTHQRQNAADLALSMLRHASKDCDKPPTLPKEVRVVK